MQKDDTERKSEDLPPEEPSKEEDNAEKSPSSPLSQHSSTQNLFDEDDDDHPIPSHAVSPKSLEKLKLKFKEQIFGDDYDSAELETSSDDQDNAVVSAKKASPPRSASKELEELKLKLKKHIFGEDYDSHDYDTTEDDDSTKSTTITSETTLTSVHGGDLRETTPSSSSVAKQPEDTGCDRETSPVPKNSGSRTPSPSPDRRR